MSEFENQVSQLNANIKRIGDEIKPLAENALRTSQEVQARMTAVEQELVAQGGIAPRSGTRSGGMMGAALLAAVSGGHTGFDYVAAGNQGSARIELSGASIKATLTNDGRSGSPTTDGLFPTPAEHGGIVAAPFRPLRLLDILPVRQVSSDAVEAIELSRSGSAGVQAHEGDEKAQIFLDGAVIRTHVCTLAAWCAASKQVLADNVALQDVIDRVLVGLLRDELENQIVNGTGGPADPGAIAGLWENGTLDMDLGSTGLIHRIGLALTHQRNRGYAPTAIAMHPADWFDNVQVVVGSDGHYVFGSPTSPVQPSLWGLPVAMSTSVPSGGAMVLDTSRITLLDRMEPIVMVSNSHADFFTRNKVAILGEMRCGLEIVDPLAAYLVPPSSN